MKAIIPCCGLGTRVGMLANQSKELLWDEENQNYIISWCIQQCWLACIEPLVLLRKEKTDLIQYCIDHEVDYVIMEPGQEWADTVLKSYKNWDAQNILFLPDVRFSDPMTVLETMKLHLRFTNLTIGLHEVKDVSKWGMVNPWTQMVVEKPKEFETDCAWGVIGFRAAEGYKFFEDMVNLKSSFIPVNTQYVNCKNFEDLTREKNNKYEYLGYSQ